MQRGQASVVRNIGPDAAADEEGQHCRLTAEGGVMHRTAESRVKNECVKHQQAHAREHVPVAIFVAQGTADGV